MACIMSTYYLAGKPRPMTHSLSLPAKIRALNLTQPTKLRSSVRVYSCAESDRLPIGVRDRAIDAIDSTDRRVTIGDVVTKVSLDLNQSQKALQALAVDTNGFLEVSDEGDVVYVFPKDYRSKLAAKSVKSFKMKIKSFWEKWKMAATLFVDYTFRIALGVAVVASFHDKNDIYPHAKLAMSLADDGRFVDCVFSMVFGDGDPNQGIEEKRWKMIGQYIALNGGVVTAEELAPYFDPETTKKLEEHDESYMLPVLLRFGGQPEVNEEGHILYHFPSIQSTTSPQSRRRKKSVGKFTDGVIEVEKFLKENEWNFSKFDAKERESVGFFLCQKLYGPIFWGICFWMLKGKLGSMPLISYIVMSPLLMYAIYVISFNVIKSLRWVSVQSENADIVRRNDTREQYAKALESPNLALKQKLLSARARRTSIGKDRILFSTERDLCNCYEKDSWDQRFKKRWDFAL